MPLSASLTALQIRNDVSRTQQSFQKLSNPVATPFSVSRPKSRSISKKCVAKVETSTQNLLSSVTAFTFSAVVLFGNVPNAQAVKPLFIKAKIDAIIEEAIAEDDNSPAVDPKTGLKECPNALPSIKELFGCAPDPEILEERDARKTVEKGDATISYNDFLGLVKQGDIVSVSFQMSGAQIVSEGKDGTFEKIDLPETVVNRELNRTLIKSDVRVTVYANRQK